MQLDLHVNVINKEMFFMQVNHSKILGICLASHFHLTANSSISLFVCFPEKQGENRWETECNQ